MSKEYAFAVVYVATSLRHTGQVEDIVNGLYLKHGTATHSEIAAIW